MNEKGKMSTVTTTSGMAWKISGSCGDSPIIGGGLWLDQDVGGVGSTGRGEGNLRGAGAHTIVENMRHGMSPIGAALDCLKRVARNFDNDERRLQQLDLNFYVLRKPGEHCAASLWKNNDPGFAVCTEGNARMGTGLIPSGSKGLILIENPRSMTKKMRFALGFVYNDSSTEEQLVAGCFPPEMRQDKILTVRPGRQ